VKKVAVLLSALLSANQSSAIDVIAEGTISCYVKDSIEHGMDSKGNLSLKRKNNNGVFQMKYSLSNELLGKYVTFSNPISTNTNFDTNAPYIPSIFEKIGIKELKIQGDFINHKSRNIFIYKYFMRPDESLTLSAEDEKLRNWHAVGVFPSSYGNVMNGLSTLMVCQVDIFEYSKFYKEVFKAVKEQDQQ